MNKEPDVTQAAWFRDGQPIDAATIPIEKWEKLKQTYQLGDFLMPCCSAHAVPKTSINGFQFFAHLSDECATAPETQWHKAGKVAVLVALSQIDILGNEEVQGQSPSGEKWQADILFSVFDRTIAIELQRSYQHLRDFTRRQERYAASSVECYWLVRKDNFKTLAKATAQLRLKRDYDNNFPSSGLGTGMLPELPVAMLDNDEQMPIKFGLRKEATIAIWLEGIINNSYQYRDGSWSLG